MLKRYPIFLSIGSYFLLAIFGIDFSISALAGELAGASIIPHQIDTELKYRREHDPVLASRLQLFVRGPASFKSLNKKSPAELLQEGAIAWHDLANPHPIPEGALSVWNINGKSNAFSLGNNITLEAADMATSTIALNAPSRWISSVTFLRSDKSPASQPNRIMIYVENRTDKNLEVSHVKLWLPKSGGEYQILWPQPEIEADQTISPSEKGFIDLTTSDLPLTYAAIELKTNEGSIWTHLRIKREHFDISGGWVFDSREKWRNATVTDPNSGQTYNRFLDLLSSMHINTAQYENAGGYSDNPQLYQRNPLKRFSRLWPTDPWEAEPNLATVHAVEFLGEPQYGGGRPVPPQEVYDAFLPYRKTKLPTSVTHSEERIWRLYAGLSDYPHFDAYRVVAPAADNWRLYDRWNGTKISWGAPLESIGNLCRSQRELNRPLPCAAWSQGPHDGWGGGFSLTKRRARRSPNPAELRSQAMHALASRITSLYWFNLSKPSLEKFPDTWEAMRRIGREIRMLEELYLEGDAYRFRKLTKDNGEPNWELSSILSPQGMLLFAIDTDYKIDPDKQEFVFGPPRASVFEFAIPSCHSSNLDVKRVDADGIHPTTWKQLDGKIEITENATADCIYVLTSKPALFESIEAKRLKAIEIEQQFAKTALAPKP